jgi:cytosine/creatinine deaminase
VFDLLIRGAIVAGADGPRDIAIVGSAIREIAPRIRDAAKREVDAAGRLALPPFVDPHFHLDSVLAAVPNHSGTLREGIDNWREYKRTRLTIEDVEERAGRYCERAAAMGIQAIRSHVDVCDSGLRGVRALVRVRERVRDRIDVQLVAFPQDGYFHDAGVPRQLEQALDLGVDVIGGIPHHERTAELGRDSITRLLELAARRGLPVDMHCDESDDAASRQVEHLAAETIRLGLQGRVTASHVTSMAMMDPYYVSRKLIPLMAEARLAVIANPLINIHLGGRFHHPSPRGMAPIRALLAAGIRVACGQDCNEDPWYPLGNADMIEVAKMAAHVGHMMGTKDLAAMLETVTTHAAAILGLERYGVAPGCRASLLLLDAATPLEALRTSPRRSLVVRDGRVLREA